MVEPVLVEAPTTARAGRLAALAAMFGRHQVASLISTVVDFGSMIAVVELLHLGAVVGTCIGATCGAVTNFTLGRYFTFVARSEHAAPQAARYAVVSAASMGWNALGEYVLHDRLGVQYMVARAIVAVAVSVFWNFPLQRWFVFADHRRAQPRSTPD